MTAPAEVYVRLVLALGLHDEDYVDAYYGPPEWRAAVERERPSLETILARARDLAARLDGAAPPEGAGEVDWLRHVFLTRQLGALIARAEQLAGRRFTFDEESLALYDAVAPPQSEADLAGRVAELEAHVPGAGLLPERLQAYRARFYVPVERLEAAIDAALRESRARTLAHLTLPEGESFTWERVTDKPWSGYNWYRGAYASLIQINVDLPLHVGRLLDLACHEGYPGHHAYNALLEQHLVRERGWPEFSVYPLSSPQSLIAEGTANVAPDVAFPGGEKLSFLRDALFPLAGFDPAEVEPYERVLRLSGQLDRAGNEIARRYLDGAMSADTAVDWYVRYMLMERVRAEQRVRFVDRYRSYVVNYTLGEDLVRQHIERLGGDDAHPDRRWALFRELLTTPRVPSTLAGAAPSR
ncbi:MAG TPA: hypothetical protein VFX49_09875 [Chloroflexota bacterium]|nr:hypothetical protein [Chloroflexota bacterium]